MRLPPRSGTRWRNGGRCSSSARSASRATPRRSRSPWLARGLELARREGYEAGEAIGIYSLGVVHWMLGDLDGADALLRRASRLPRARDPSERSPRRSTSPRSGRAGPTADPGCDRVRGHAAAVHRDLVRSRRRLRARESGRHRACARRPAAGRALLDESAERFGAADDDRPGSRPRPARLSRALRGRLPTAREPRAGARPAAPAARPARRRARARGARPGRHDGGRVRQRGAASRRGARHLPARRRPLGPREPLWRTADLALARGSLDERRGRAEEARAVLGETQRERWIAHTLAGLARLRCCGVTPSAASNCFAEARDRYAAP